MAFLVPTYSWAKTQPSQDTVMLFAPCECTHPPPPVPPFLLMQNLPPRTLPEVIPVMKLKVSQYHMKSLGRKGLRARSSTKITLKPTKQRCSTKTTLQTGSAHAVGASYSGLQEDGKAEHTKVPPYSPLRYTQAESESNEIYQGHYKVKED